MHLITYVENGSNRKTHKGFPDKVRDELYMEE